MTASQGPGNRPAPSRLLEKYSKGTGSYATVGIELALSVLLGLAVGHWLDKKLGTDPWLTLIGVGFGMAAGFRALWRQLERANREAERMEREEKQARKDFHDERDPKD